MSAGVPRASVMATLCSSPPLRFLTCSTHVQIGFRSEALTAPMRLGESPGRRRTLEKVQALNDESLQCSLAMEL